MNEPSPNAAADTWDGILATLRRRYPDQKDSVLFCIYKLQQNPDLTLRDFRDEAKMYGIPTAGRALHSARGLLGLQQEAPTPRARAAAAAPTADRDELAADALPRLARAERRKARQQREAAADGSASIETQVLAAIRQIQSTAGSQTERLRTAMREAVAVLQRALGDD